MTPQEFCSEIMHELEEQWARAFGHQNRHPIQEKMRVMREIFAKVKTVQEMDALLGEGKRSEDPMLWMVCQELAPRWEAAKRGRG